MAKESNKEKVLSALLQSNSVAEAAKISGIAERTIYRYLNEKDFQTEVRAARRSVVETSIGQIQGAASEAVETLKKNLHCGNPSAEIRAAQIILENSVKGIEMLDILERLEILENEHQKQN